MMTSIEDSLGHCLDIHSVNEDGTSVSAHCCFPPEFIGFQGHFPDNPVVPAIVQLAAVRRLAESVVQRKLQPVSYTRTKFRGMIRPQQKVSLHLDLTGEPCGCRGKFHIRDAAAASLAEGSFTFGFEE